MPGFQEAPDVIASENSVPEVKVTLAAPEHIGNLLSLELFGSGLADVRDSAVDVDRRCLNLCSRMS